MQTRQQLLAFSRLLIVIALTLASLACVQSAQAFGRAFVVPGTAVDGVITAVAIDSDGHKGDASFLFATTGGPGDGRHLWRVVAEGPHQCLIGPNAGCPQQLPDGEYVQSIGVMPSGDLLLATRNGAYYHSGGLYRYSPARPGRPASLTTLLHTYRSTEATIDGAPVERVGGISSVAVTDEGEVLVAGSIAPAENRIWLLGRGPAGGPPALRTVIGGGATQIAGADFTPGSAAELRGLGMPLVAARSLDAFVVVVDGFTLLQVHRSKQQPDSFAVRRLPADHRAQQGLGGGSRTEHVAMDSEGNLFTDTRNNSRIARTQPLTADGGTFEEVVSGGFGRLGPPKNSVLPLDDWSVLVGSMAVSSLHQRDGGDDLLVFDRYSNRLAFVTTSEAHRKFLGLYTDARFADQTGDVKKFTRTVETLRAIQARKLPDLKRNLADSADVPDDVAAIVAGYATESRSDALDPLRARLVLNALQTDFGDLDTYWLRNIGPVRAFGWCASQALSALRGINV